MKKNREKFVGCLDVRNTGKSMISCYSRRLVRAHFNHDVCFRSFKNLLNMVDAIKIIFQNLKLVLWGKENQSFWYVFGDWYLPLIYHDMAVIWGGECIENGKLINAYINKPRFIASASTAWNAHFLSWKHYRGMWLHRSPAADLSIALMDETVLEECEKTRTIC